jgi:hypothetical protein
MLKASLLVGFIWYFDRGGVLVYTDLPFHVFAFPASFFLLLFASSPSTAGAGAASASSPGAG